MSKTPEKTAEMLDLINTVFEFLTTITKSIGETSDEEAAEATLAQLNAMPLDEVLNLADKFAEIEWLVGSLKELIRKTFVKRSIAEHGGPATIEHMIKKLFPGAMVLNEDMLRSLINSQGN